MQHGRNKKSPVIRASALLLGLDAHRTAQRLAKALQLQTGALLWRHLPDLAARLLDLLGKAAWLGLLHDLCQLKRLRADQPTAIAVAPYD